MISHSPVFREAFVDYMGSETPAPKELEIRESNYMDTINKRKKENSGIR